MVFDLGALPPEINSALMYAGPGSESMLAAAFAWGGLAAELNTAATAYDAQITSLTGDEWLGPASESMAQAAQPYVAWMSATAGQAEQAATQAMAAAVAYERALAATVHPAMVTANRTQLAQLVATNVLGQNIPAIVATEAQYAEMWAQDATAMYGYAADSAAAANVTQFTTPAQTTNPAGQAIQSAAVALASGTAAGTAQSTLSQWMSQLTGLLGQLASPTTVAKDLGLTPASASLTQIAFDPSTMVGSMLAGIGGNANLNPSWFITAFRNFAGPAYNLEGLVSFSTGISNTLVSLQKALTPAAAAAAAAAKPAADAVAGLMGGGHGGIGAGIAAGLGQAASVGKLSVPAAWSDALPALSHAATPRPIAITSAATPEAASPGSMLGGMPLAAAKAGATGAGPRYGLRPTVMARPPFAG